MNKFGVKFQVRFLVVLFGLLLLGVTNVYGSGSAYSRARAYLRSDAPSGSGKVYVGQAATSSPNYQTSSTSEKQGEKTTTTYHFYAQAATGYKFTGWYSKNANDEYVAASNSTVSGTTYTYTDAHYAVNVTSGSNPSSGTSYTDKDLYAGFIKVVQMSFIRPEDGSFTITHNGAAVADYASFTVDGKVVLTATPDAGYKLRGWYTTTDGGVTKNYFAFSEVVEPSLTSNVTIGAEFVLDDGKADFWVKGTTTTYNNLNDANTAAAATSAKTIVLVNSGTLPAGTYTISSGVTLLIPYGSDYSKTDQPNIVHVTSIGSAPALSVYKKLSLAAGATINCSGKICVGGQVMSINGGNPTSVVRGRAGVLDLSRGGTISLNSGSALYAWGFVQGQDIDQGNNTSGMGTIDAKSGSTVWEVFQCGEWRGGTASSTIYSNRSSWKFFPFQSYTVQNIEAPITYRAGATGKCKWTIFGDGKIYTVDFTLIGSSNALFNMSSGATLNKRYDATTDRICYELNGTNAVNALSLSAMGETINSSEYRLPIPANMQITVTGGTTSISNQMVLHAGAYVDIRSGATLNINTNVYIFDQTDWDTYCMYKYYYRSYKSLTKHYDRGEGTSKATLEDATVIVDGNLTFGGSGRLYATTNGANIRGNNGGRITFGTLPTQTTIVMCKELKDNVSVSVSSANMHNIDGSYTKSVASTAFYNVNGRWFSATDKDPKADHTYKFTYIKSGAVYGTGGTNATINTIYRSGWIDVKADVCDDWWDGLADTYLYNYTFNNAWHQYENTSTVIGEGDEAATIYSGTDNNLYAKTECNWEEYAGADENCLQTMGGVKKAFINGSFVALTKNTEDEAYHNSANATEYYICFKDGCEWYAATKVAGANKAYTVTATSQKYIWYNGAWLAATQEAPYFYTRSGSGEKTYYEYVGSEWTEANVVAESTRNGAMTRYFNLPDAFADANDNTKPGESTTIKIMKNVTITSALTYRPVDAKGGTCTIDLNGFTLSGSIDNMITINHDKAVLVVLDQSPEETGKISISYSANNTRRRAVYVQNGRLMLNSGTIQATNSQAYVDAIYVAANELCDINGGQVKATATSGAYGIHTAGGTARCTIKGGTITATSPASKGVYSEGGEIRMSAGTVNATTTGTEAMGLATTNTATSLITLTGGTVNATAASTAVGVQVGASGGTNGTATISGGTVKAKTTGATARALRSYATTTVNGGTFIATAATSDARGITVGSGVMRINAGVLVNDTANTQAYAVYTAGGKTWVNGGQFRSATKNTTSAYGFYANAGTDTINGGDFFVTSKTTDAYGIFVPSTTPTVRLNGGKFMVKTSNGSAAGAINNTAASTNLVLAAGYFNVAPAGSYVLTGKEVKDLDATVEASLISAGYTKKIAGTEYTVTWKSYDGKTTLKTEKVESEKVPVWTGTIPDQSTSTTTREADGWCTAKSNGGTNYATGTPLPAIVASDVTYFVHVKTVYAEVTADGTTNRYYGRADWWTAAMKKKQAYIKLLSNYSKSDHLEFTPTNDNSVITLDLNGHTFGNGTRTATHAYGNLINVNKAGCRLIITDNTASGKGCIYAQWANDATLDGVKVSNGELVLNGGTIKCINSYKTAQHARGVNVVSTGKFTMTGGSIEVERPDTVSGGIAYGVFSNGIVDLAAGTIKATHKGDNQARGITIDNSKQANLGDGLDVRVAGNTTCFGIYALDTVYVNGGSYDVQADTIAKGFYMGKGTGTGYTSIDGTPSFSVAARGSVYGVQINGSGVTADVESGTFDVEATSGKNAYGAVSETSSTMNVKGGEFNVTLGGTTECRAAQASSSSTMNISGGTFTVYSNVTSNVELTRCSTGDATRLNISGGTFTMAKGSHAVSCFGGETRITGNPVFTSPNGLVAAHWASAAGTATAIVDGGTFVCTGWTLKSTTHTTGGKTVVGDVTVLDGKFKTTGSTVIDNTKSSYAYLKIKGGYFSNNASGRLSVYDAENNSTGYVESPSTVESCDTTIDGRNYTYHVKAQFSITWNDGTSDLRVDNLNRNEIPSYGSTPVHSGSDTYEFIGWSPEIAPATENVTYTAQWRKYEAEVIEGESATGTKFESFADAFNLAQNMPVAKIKILSNVYYGTGLTLNPDSASGSRPLTIDLNNHIVNYTKTDNSFALTINKAGCKLIIDDSSVAKGGQFGHRKVAATGTSIRAIYLQNGELELRNGTIIAQNNNNDGASGTATRVVTGSAGTVFTMTGGKLYAKSRLDARAFNSDGAAIFNATGGTIEATNEYTDSGTKWGSNAYGVVLWNNGTFNMSGTATMSIHSGAGALGVYPYGANAVANITGGSINCLAEVNTARCVQAINSGRANISGGDFTANGPDSGSNYNIETISIQGVPGGVVNVTGGTFHSDHGSPRAGVRVFGGTVNISGNPYFTTYNGICVGDWATAETISATAYVNGGTFVCPGYALYARESTNKYSGDLNGTVTGTMYVNGGYFKSTGSTICSTSSQAGRLILNGGYYSESAGTTQKTNITTYKGATTEVSTLSPVVHDAYSNDYHYQLLTDFDITWLGGSTYSKVEQVKSGTVPSNTELVGKCFIRNDSAFYFTGWSPTPSTVVGNTTYNAVGDYYEAEVKIGSGAWAKYTDFLEAWAVVQENANCTIRLLSNFTLTDKILYKPTVANARTVFDLNNFTMTIGGTSTSGIDFNKADAVLTITDGSSAKGGKISLTRTTTSSTYVIYIYNGELKMAGGKIYCQNNQNRINDSSWWPCIAIFVSNGANAKLTMTGGTVESRAAYLAYPLYNYGTTNISGGTVIANATGAGSSLGLYAVNGTATISGGTFNITATSTATGVNATGSVNNTGTSCINGTLNVTGGTFNVSATTQNVYGIQVNGTGKNIGGTVYTAHGIINVSGGTFNVTCSAATATQVFAAHCSAWRLFDEATPHTMLGESRGELNISGGTFTVDARNSGAWVTNKGNVDLLRNWGTLNVSGGNFTIHQYSTPSAIGVFRGKATVTGNPVFNVYAHTGNAYAVCAGYWTHENYCDKDAANNLAEAEINGGTFKIITEGQNTNVIYSLGQISAESRDGETITAHAGYAMNAKVTVNGGEFLGICPNASGKYPIMLNSMVDQVGTYGTAKSEIYVNGGKFKSRKGTEADNTTSGAVNCHNNVGTLLLTGGYYETNGQLAAQKADTCVITNITSADIDPEYNNGYRYRIDIHYVAQVTAAGVDRKFATLKGALDYARTVNNSTVTILNDCNFETDGQYGYGLGTTGKTMTIDLNNHTVNATNSVTSYDRVFGASGQITVTDNSVAKGGKLNLTKNHNGTFIGIVLNDACQLTLANGTIYVENEMASKSATAINIWGTTGIFRQTGGTLQVKATSGLAEGIHMRGTANISGGNVIATSVGNNARAFAQDADAANSKYSSLTVSGTPTITVSGAGEVSGVYSNIANTSATISGGTWNISSTSSGAHGVRLSKTNASATISGGTFNVTTTTTSAYGVYVSSSGSATVTGGTFNATATTTNAYGIYVSNGASGTVSGGTFTSRTGANKNECFGAFATGTGTTLDITGGTFDVNSADNAGGNINVVRVQPGATVTISGGTFRSAATGGNALVSFGGVTTVSGTALFEAQTGAYVGSWYQGDGSSNVTATVNLNGGTFNVTGVAINATWNTKYENKVYLSSPFINSIVNVNGGRYKTTGGTIVQKKADGADGGTAVLNIAGGYFNEKSGTTFKDQISSYVADTSRINTLDPLLEGIYKYEVAPHYVAKVKTGSTTTYYTTAKRALDYAKTVANPTITLLDNCTLTDANYTINPGNWTGTLDLNNFTLTPTIHAENGRAFTIGGTGTKFIVTDNSVGQGGQIYYKGNSSVSIIYFVVAGGEMELAGGTLYVENTNASKKAIGFVVDGNPSQFTQSGGTFTIKGAYGANGYYGRGTATFTGGTMNVDGGTHQAIGLFPQESTSKLYVSGTFALNVTSSLVDSYGVLVKNSGATGTISGGKFNFNQNTMVGAQLDGILTITGGYFVEHPSQAGRYKSQIAAFVPDTCDLNTLDPLYESKYKYQVVVHHVAKVVESGGAETYFALLTSALDYFKTKNNATLKMLDNAELPASPSRYTLIPTISNWRGTWDLNDKTVSCTYSAPGYAMFDLNKADAILTITDNSVAKRGRLEHIESSASAAVWGLNIENGEIILEAGTIYAKNPNADATGSKYGISVKNANSRFTMNGGRIECVGSTNTQGLNLSGGSTATVSGGKILSIAELNGTVGNYAYGIYISGTSTLTVNGADSIYAKAGKADNTRAYALNAGGGTVTIEGTPFFIAESPSKGARVLQSSGTANVTVNGGTFESKAGTTDSYALIAEGTSTMTVNGGKYKTNQTNITYKSADATLTINGGYYNESSGTNHKTRVANYLGSGKVILNLDAADAEYIAGYRYIVTADPVAKVKAGSEITYYTSVADAITAANLMTNPTVTMLKDATTTQQTISAAMTIDLNGKTISSTESKNRAVFVIDAAGSTITIKDSGIGGRIERNTAYDGDIYGIYLKGGSLDMQGGAIYANNTTTTENTNYHAYGIYSKVASTSMTISDGSIEAHCSTNGSMGIYTYGTLTMTGGEVKASGAGTIRGIYTRSTAESPITVSLTNVTVESEASGTNSVAVYTYLGSNVTIHSGTYTATAASTGYAVYARNYASNIITINDGRFNGSDQDVLRAGSNAQISIIGGYYVHNTSIQSYCASNHHVFDLADQSPYLYEVAEGYDLTWTSDGDPLTGTYTSGTTKVGTTIVQPNTPTKTGYTFAGWSPSAPAATMPAANTTYTATWTINSYDVTFNMQGHGSAISKQTINYNGLVSEPAAPTAVNYVFGGWYKEAGCTNAWNFSTDHVTAATTLYAKWTPAVASVQKGAASPTYHTTLADAFATASSTAKNATVTITVLQNISGITEQINYAPTNVCTTTLDLNGYKVEGSVTSENARLISFGKQGAVLEITDSRTGGELHNEAEFNSTLLCVYVNYGHLKISGGTISVKNTSTGGSQYAYAVQTRSNASTSNVQLTMTGGTVKAEGAYRVYALYPQCEANISGGRIEANATGTGYAVGILANPKSGSKTTIGGSVEVSVESGKDYAEAIRAYGTVDVQGGTFDATSVATYAYGIRTYTGTTTVTNNPSFTIRAKQYAIGVQAGERPSTSGGLYDGTAVIRGGTFDVSTTTPANSSYTKAYGVLAYANTRQGKTGYEGNYASAGTVDVYDGTFEVNGYSAVYGIYSMGTATLATEPYESASATAKMNIYGGKFKVLGTSGKAAIVATSATITNTDVVVEGGWYNISTNLDQYTAPTKDCNYYVQPLADATYKWQVSEVANTGFYADIVDVDNTNSKLILNVTGWAANGWPYTINGVAYEKTAREADRTLKIPYVGEPGDHFAIKVQKSDETTVSHRTYIVPKEVTANASLAQNRDRNTYVNDGATLTVTANVTTRNIYVAPGAKLVINSGKTLTADTIFLRTTAAEAAELENNGTIAGTTKVVYTRIIKDKDFHLFGLPLSCPVSSVHLSDGVTPMYTTGWVLRSYDEERRADYGADDNNWTTLAADGTIAGGKGYEMFSASAYYREFYFPVNLAELTNQVAVTYHLGAKGEKQAGWNAITSPFTHTYANAKVPEGLVVNWYQDGYGYYEQEIPSSIPPAYPFAIQATQNGYISFAGSSIVAAKPRRAAAEEEQQIQWINLDITDQNGVGDQTSVYSHPDRYDANYQIGIDVAKRSLTASRAIIYSSHAYGDMAFAGVADSLLEQGVALTVYSPSEQELVISMRENDWLDRMENVWLVDKKTGMRVDLIWSDYALRVPAGTTAGRLYIEGQFKAPQVVTDLEPTSDSSLKGRDVRKVIINDKIYIIVNGRMYDSTGKLVETGKQEGEN